nr:hypothetical protein [uncultured Mediterranean phage uvMED]BAR25754.1 hypothetical protein [uncultured Mediterranean phage uvMED]
MSIELNSEDIIVYFKFLYEIEIAYCFWNGNIIEIQKENKELPELQVELLEQINNLAVQLKSVKEINTDIPKTTSNEI